MPLNPVSLAVRPAQWGFVWRIKLIVDGDGHVYASGWRPSSAGAERAGRRRFEAMERRYQRQTGWSDVTG